MSEMMGMGGGNGDLEALAHPQPLFKLLRDAASAVEVPGEIGTMMVVGGDEDVRYVLQHPEIFSSGIDAVAIGQVRPLIPLQIDPPDHKKFRKLLDPIFAPKQVAQLEPATRQLVKEMVEKVAGDGRCNFHHAIAEPIPSTVFLQLLGLPVSRAQEFIALKDGIIRPPVKTMQERREVVREVGQRIYAVLQEVIDERRAEPKDDFISMFLEAEVDGHSLSNDDILDIGYLFFLAGLDTVTASLDCMVSYLAQHGEQRERLVKDPSIIQHAVEEMLRWESPVTGVIRITTQETELNGCPIKAHQPVSVILGSANTDERSWENADVVDFDREVNRHLSFGGGIHRCLGSHLARMELRVALEEWHAAVPDYRLADGVELHYSQGLRSVENLELVW